MSVLTTWYVYILCACIEPMARKGTAFSGTRVTLPCGYLDLNLGPGRAATALEH